MSNDKFIKIDELYYSSLHNKEAFDLVSILKESFDDYEIVDEQERGLYHYAVKYKNADAIHFLSEQGVKPRPDKYGSCPLHLLAESVMSINQLEDIEDDLYAVAVALIKAKDNPKRKNDNGKTAYWLASERVNYPVLKAMGEEKVVMNAIGEEQKNILHLICDRAGHRKNDKKWLSAAAKCLKAIMATESIDVEDEDIFGCSPLKYAQRNEAINLAAILLDNEEESIIGGMTLHEAVLYNNEEAVKEIIASGVNLDEVDHNNLTPLMIACKLLYLNSITRLLDAGANVNYKDGVKQHTALYYFINTTSFQLCGDKTLIRNIIRKLDKAQINWNDTIDQSGNTILMLLAQSIYLKEHQTMIVEELIDAGIDINKANYDGETALMFFSSLCDENKYGVVEILLDNGAETNSTDKYNNTALMYACINEQQMAAKRIAELILSKDSSIISKVNNRQMTAMDLAVTKNNEATVKVLLNYL